MPITLTDDESEKILLAMEHYAAYLVSQQRDDEPYRLLIDRLTSQEPAASKRPAPKKRRKLA